VKLSDESQTASEGRKCKHIFANPLSFTKLSNLWFFRRCGICLPAASVREHSISRSFLSTAGASSCCSWD